MDKNFTVVTWRGSDQPDDSHTLRPAWRLEDEQSPRCITDQAFVSVDGATVGELLAALFRRFLGR